MNKIIWVKGELVDNAQLVDAIERIPTRECVIVKVESVQEAIVELYEGTGTVALIICDRVLEMSLPPQELWAIAKTKDIPYLIAGEKQFFKHAPHKRVPSLFETHRVRTTRTAMSLLLSALPIKEVFERDMGEATSCVMAL